MARTHGRAPLPLPDGLPARLEDLGYKLMPYTSGGVPVWRHPASPDLYLSAVAGNLPGESMVTASWQGQGAIRCEPDYLIARLTVQLSDLRVKR